MLRVARHGDDGFTLIELLIVVTVTPIIIGSLAAGLIAMLSLQSGVQTRLSNSADSQMVQASYRNDVQSAQQITTASSSTPQCGSGDQLLGLEWNLNSSTHVYQTMVSYVSVPVTVGSKTTYSLERLYCTYNTAAGAVELSSTTTIASNLEGSQVAATVTPSTSGASGGWVLTTGITDVSFPITEPEGSSAYSYTLVATPPTSAQDVDPGGPHSGTTEAGCGYAAAGSGTYASSLCLVDLASMTGNNMVAARQGCVELSVPLPGGATMYFCIGITGAPVAPYALPTWTDGFLGNSINGIPFYTDVDNSSGQPADAALYQSCEGSSSTCDVDGATVNNVWGGVTTITISDITVVSADGNPATGWEFVSADAESTDSGESITWTSDRNLYDIPNGEAGDSASDPIGNACNSGAGVSGTTSTGTSLTAAQIFAGTGATTIVCDGDSNGVKTGTLMVEALTPTSMTVTMVGTGLEGISLGLLF